MRALSLIPFAIAVVVAGCGSEPAEGGRASGVPQRDLTLQQAPAPEMAVASALEAPRPRPERPMIHRPRRSPDQALAPARDPGSPEAAPNAEPVAVPTGAGAEGVVQRGAAEQQAVEDRPDQAVAPAPAQAAAPPIVDEAVDPHALAPGKTVTIVPVSSGPSTGSGRADDEMPSRAGRAIIMMGGGHGDTCRGHGAGALR